MQTHNTAADYKFFEAPPAWSDRPIRERAEVFYRLRELMLLDLEELARPDRRKSVHVLLPVNEHIPNVPRRTLSAAAARPARTSRPWPKS